MISDDLGWHAMYALHGNHFSRSSVRTNKIRSSETMSSVMVCSTCVASCDIEFRASRASLCKDLFGVIAFSRRRSSSASARVRRTKEGADAAENEYQETVSEAVVLMKSQGHGFGNELDFLEDMLTRKAMNDVSWLKRLLVQYAPGGRNHKRVNKRYSSGGIIFPKNETKGKSHGLIMVDTSGSMGNAECDEAFVQMNKIIQEFPHTKITMVQCDTDIHEESIREFSRSDLPLRVPRKWYGRGGTDMEPVLKYAKDNKYKFDWAVCITDMEWDWENCTDSGIVTKFVAVNPYRPLGINMPQRGYSYEEVYVNV